MVMAAVSVVLPWSTCPIVPTFTCGFVRSNFAFAIGNHLRRTAINLSGRELPELQHNAAASPPRLTLRLRDDLVRHRLRQRLVPGELHRVHGAPLRDRAHAR